MKLVTPPEYVLRGLRMSLGVATCLGIGYMAINYQFIGEAKYREGPCWLSLRASCSVIDCPSPMASRM